MGIDLRLATHQTTAALIYGYTQDLSTIPFRPIAIILIGICCNFSAKTKFNKLI